MNIENNDSLNICVECESLYYKKTSKMSALCPECSHILYSYPNCSHDMATGRCAICYWDGSRSAHLKSLLFEPTLDIPKTKKRTVLLTIGVLFEVNQDELEDDYNTIDHFKDKTHIALEEAMSIYKGNAHLGWTSSRASILDDGSMNCGQCEVCEIWVTDMEKPQPILELEPGFIRGGRLLCEEHLPEELEST